MFKLQRKASAATQVIEYYEGTASEAITIGEVLKLVSGKLTKAGATDVPEFVALSDGNGTKIAVQRIYEDDVFQTTLAAAGTSLKVGDKVTVHTDGKQATATTASGVFMITEILDSAQGGKINGMFRR